MIKNIKVYKESTELHDVLCDCCGNSCKTSFGFEYMELKSSWGFSSGKDLQRWSAQVCETCVDEKLSFIKFNVKNHND